MAINVKYNPQMIYTPNGSSGPFFPAWGPEWVRHEMPAPTMAEITLYSIEFYRVNLAALRALRNVRIISGVRSHFNSEIWIDAREPQDG